MVAQDSLSYKQNLLKLKPTYVVHGDDWQDGVQRKIRTEVVETLAEYGGQLVEFSYTHNRFYVELEKRIEKGL